MFLRLADLDARGGLHIVELAPGDLAVILIPRDAEVDVAIFCRVSIALFDQALDELNDERHRLTDLGIGRGRQHIQILQITPIVLDIALRELERIFAELVGAVDDFVVHVGVIHNVVDFVAAVFEITPDDIEHQRRHGMPHMRVIVNGHAADVHPDHVWLETLKFFFFAREGVVETDHCIPFSKYKEYSSTKEEPVFVFTCFLVYLCASYFLFRMFSSSTRAKTMRPAAVCRTLVTATSLYSPMKSC